MLMPIEKYIETTVERSAEDLVRSYAKAYGETEEPVADHYGIFWMGVGHNASHAFELGWNNNGRLFKRSMGEALPKVDADHELSCKRKPETCYCTIYAEHTSEVEIGNPGYVGHH